MTSAVGDIAEFAPTLKDCFLDVIREAKDLAIFIGFRGRRLALRKPVRPRQISTCPGTEKLYEGQPVQPSPGRVTELPARVEPDSDPMVPVSRVLGERELTRVALQRRQLATSE
jgi:hypothetical protein